MGKRDTHRLQCGSGSSGEGGSRTKGRIQLACYIYIVTNGLRRHVMGEQADAEGTDILWVEQVV